MCGDVLPEPLLRHPQEGHDFLVHLFQSLNIIVGFFQGMLLGEFSLCEGLSEDLLELRDEH